MNYSIGQIIYVLSNKTQTVLPGIIREEIHYRSLDGENVSYKIAIGPQSKQRVIDLSTVDGEVYGSLEEVRNILVSRLTSFVDDLCATTNEKVYQWYGNGSRPAAPTNTPGRLDPSELLNEVAAQPAKPQNLANNLRSAFIDPELTTREVVMDDGSIRKISVNV
jgi:hypothetical protein